MTQGFDGRRVSRRRLLGVGGAALAAASAGCSGLPPLGGRVNFGSVDGPDPADPAYRQWIPAPSAAPDDARFGTYHLWYGEPSRFAALDADPPANQARGFLAPQTDYFGVGFDAYERALWTGPVLVLEGDVSPATVAETVTDSGYDPAGSYGDYDLFERGDAPRTVAVREGVVLFARTETGRRDVELVADAGGGAVPRLHEESDAFAAISDATGAYPFVLFTDVSPGIDDAIGPTAWDGVETSSSATTFDDGYLYFVVTQVYEDASAVDRGDIKAQLDGDGYLRSYDSRAVDIEVDGRVARIVSQVAVEEVLDERDGTERMPQVTWGFDEADGTLTVRHEAGETVDARIPTLYWETEDAEPPGAQFADEYETVGPGDALTVDVSDLSPGTELQLVYNLPSGSRSATANEYEVNA